MFRVFKVLGKLPYSRSQKLSTVHLNTDIQTHILHNLFLHTFQLPFNPVSDKKQITKFMSAKFHKVFFPNYII